MYYVYIYHMGVILGEPPAQVVHRDIHARDALQHDLIKQRQRRPLLGLQGLH